MESISTIYFSPTGTTKQILTAIAEGMDRKDYKQLDITHSALNSSVEGIVLIGAPVYAGRLPTDFVDRLKSVKLDHCLCVLVVVYGNRAFDDALLELKDMVALKGGHIIGASAFIGEHSLSDDAHPIAPGRPDIQDLNIAREFGKKIKNSPIDKIADIVVPGNRPYRELNPKNEVVIITDESKCTHCHDCINVCPVGAIPKDNPLITDGNLCLRCCACIKTCAFSARELKDEMSINIRQKLYINCQERQEPELFLA
ncbi:flavodoxin domain-containing protein [Spirochaeta cellobiosiphila]|uniref:flavodoxin domain-containing protein n=1 Tax=Spirochaeta cellobiosiphila TaxID=504483 RepID=UPI00042A27BF|nr:flavodoxin domain-containing protein [Spirochaeta cellobiosiphila]